jgi:hypothetical protein
MSTILICIYSKHWPSGLLQAHAQLAAAQQHASSKRTGSKARLTHAAWPPVLQVVKMLI